MVPTASVATKDGDAVARDQHAARQPGDDARGEARRDRRDDRPALAEHDEGDHRGERRDEADRQVELADHHDEGRRGGDDRQRRDLLEEVERIGAGGEGLRRGDREADGERDEGEQRAVALEEGGGHLGTDVIACTLDDASVRPSRLCRSREPCTAG